MGKLKDQLAGIAALIAAVVAIGGGFVKYGEITTKLDAIEAKEQIVVDTSAIESNIAVLQEKVAALESQEETVVDISGIGKNKTKTANNSSLPSNIPKLKLNLERSGKLL